MRRSKVIRKPWRGRSVIKPSLRLDGKAGLQAQPITLCSGGEDDPAPSRFLRTRDGSMILICRSWCRGRAVVPLDPSFAEQKKILKR